MQHNSGTGPSLGVGMVAGELALGVVGGSGPTKSISDLARALAPPDAPRKPWWLTPWAAGVAGVFFGLPSLGALATSRGSALFVNVLFIAACVAYIMLYHSKSKEWKAIENQVPEARLRWEKEWYCLQCAHRWVPEAETITTK
ncbi:MAG: hypothetical protein M0Z41_13855 [Peptococcaceae bacterium]|nr:hypothetical protein [Peptococcaceae bacterium]